MNCFFYDVTDVINIMIVRGCDFPEPDITNSRECGFSECVKSTHSRITPGAIRVTTQCTLNSRGVL